MYGMYPMMGMMGMNSMYGMGGNVHQMFKNRYGIGNEDFGNQPYYRGYPMAVIQREYNFAQERGVGKFLKDLYA